MVARLQHAVVDSKTGAAVNAATPAQIARGCSRINTSQAEPGHGTAENYSVVEVGVPALRAVTATANRAATATDTTRIRRRVWLL